MYKETKTENVNSLDELSRDQEFCAYIGGIAKRHREKYGHLMHRVLTNTHQDYYQDAWIAISEAWLKKPKQTKGFYATTVENHFNNIRRIAMGEKRGKGLPEPSLTKLLEEENI